MHEIWAGVKAGELLHPINKRALLSGEIVPTSKDIKVVEKSQAIVHQP